MDLYEKRHRLLCRPTVRGERGVRWRKQCVRTCAFRATRPDWRRRFEDMLAEQQRHVSDTYGLVRAPIPPVAAAYEQVRGLRIQDLGRCEVSEVQVVLTADTTRARRHTCEFRPAAVGEHTTRRCRNTVAESCSHTHLLGRTTQYIRTHTFNDTIVKHLCRSLEEFKTEQATKEKQQKKQKKTHAEYSSSYARDTLVVSRAAAREYFRSFCVESVSFLDSSSSGPTSSTRSGSSMHQSLNERVPFYTHTHTLVLSTITARGTIPDCRPAKLSVQCEAGPDENNNNSESGDSPLEAPRGIRIPSSASAQDQNTLSDPMPSQTPQVVDSCTCDVCHVTFPSSAGLGQHMRKGHPKEANDRVRCATVKERWRDEEKETIEIEEAQASRPSPIAEQPSRGRTRVPGPRVP
ncbi:unnamed protein product [Trichogramma brassicae]|uniref:C2H2-type domain-containing protein n=1 Tax=Trichogramma brassicae TaxID=86971 RepID=A0A6H5I8U0_9HYME|nr:unnamed protein product [Trichogramma brassicae]